MEETVALSRKGNTVVTFSTMTSDDSLLWVVVGDKPTVETVCHRISCQSVLNSYLRYADGSKEIGL